MCTFINIGNCVPNGLNKDFVTVKCVVQQNYYTKKQVEVVSLWKKWKHIIIF